MNRRLTRSLEKAKKQRIKYMVIIAILAVLIVGALGTVIYIVASNAINQKRIKESAEQMSAYEQGLETAIEQSIALCPDVLDYVGESRTACDYFIDNINSSDDIYERATNANSLIKTAAFYLDRYMAVDIEGVEEGGSGDVQYMPETMEYNTKLGTLRNDFAENWYGYLGLSDLTSTTDNTTVINSDIDGLTDESEAESN